MKAAVVRAPREPRTIETIELDGPRANEVRIRVAASGLCHSDYHVVSGDLGLAFSIIPGHEASGVVEAGNVGHNGFKTEFGISFGDFKQSGIGREGGVKGLHPYLEVKTMVFETAPKGMQYSNGAR